MAITTHIEQTISELNTPESTMEVRLLYANIYREIAKRQAPTWPGVKLNASDTRVGIKSLGNGEVTVIFELNIVSLSTSKANDTVWVNADSSQEEHVLKVKALKLDTWLDDKQREVNHIVRNLIQSNHPILNLLRTGHQTQNSDNLQCAHALLAFAKGPAIHEVKRKHEGPAKTPAKGCGLFEQKKAKKLGRDRDRLISRRKKRKR